MNRIVSFFIGLLLVAILPCSLLAKPITRIVSLAPSLTKNLYYLKAQNRLVGCTSYCPIPAGETKNIVASAVKVNLEKVISLKPDLVIATGITDSETIASLRKMGIEVMVFYTAKSFNHICEQFTQLGKRLSCEKQAALVISQCKGKVDSLSRLSPKGKTPSIFFQIGAKPLFTVIPNTFMDDYIRLLGGRNIASDLKRGTITRESVIARNPDIIIVVTMGIVGNEEVRIWQAYSQLKAAKNKQIFVIDSDKACMPTPVSFVEALTELHTLLYPKK